MVSVIEQRAKFCFIGVPRFYDLFACAPFSTLGGGPRIQAEVQIHFREGGGRDVKEEGIARGGVGEDVTRRHFQGFLFDCMLACICRRLCFGFSVCARRY